MEDKHKELLGRQPWNDDLHYAGELVKEGHVHLCLLLLFPMMMPLPFLWPFAISLGESLGGREELRSGLGLGSLL